MLLKLKVISIYIFEIQDQLLLLNKNFGPNKTTFFILIESKFLQSVKQETLWLENNKKLRNNHFQ